MEEIFNATNYDEVKTTCAEAINAIKKGKAVGMSSSASATVAKS